MRRLMALAGVALLVASCAARAVMPPAPVAPRYPDFVYPAVPPGADPEQGTRIERGWRYLQSDSPRNAEREFQAALKTQPAFHPAAAAMGFLALARKDAKGAVGYFERALEHEVAYTPALIGRGRALLELGREGDALASFEAAVKADPSLTELQSRIAVLRFRAVQDNLARAKAATEGGRWEEARAAYGQAIAASPDSAFLYRELAVVELRAGDSGSALEDFRRAVALDAGDAASLAQIGAILEEQGDSVGALAAYEKARAIDEGAVPRERVTRLLEAAALARLPEEYRAIPAALGVTRGEVAAMVGVRLAPILARVRPRQVVVTDVRTHWAQEWITSVVRAGVMDPQPNYTFQPGARMRRGDLAQVVGRVLNLIAAARPQAASAWQGRKQKIADVPPGHLSYPAVSAAVAAGVLPLTADGTFQLLRPVTGAELVDAIARLEALAK